MTKTPTLQARLEVETRDSVLVVRLDGGPLGLIGLDMAEKFSELLDGLDSDTAIKAVVFTGTHPGPGKALQDQVMEAGLIPRGSTTTVGLQMRISENQTPQASNFAWPSDSR